MCELWGWRTPTGRLRDITCRDILRALEARGLIALPPRLGPARRPGYKNKTRLTAELNNTAFECSLSELGSMSFEIVRGTSEEAGFNALIGAFHYRGYHQGSGEQLKYVVSAGGRPLACIGFGSASFKIAARDRFIG
ncbi:MAG: Druantia anti-phage system protein DruA [bacterium]